MDKKFDSILSIALIPQTIALIVEKDGVDDITAINEFYQSKTYDLLSKEETDNFFLNYLRKTYNPNATNDDVKTLYDAIDDYMVKSGRRDDGTAYSLFTFCRQIGQTVAAILVNAGLMSFNYDKDLIGNSPEMLESMYLQSCLIPAILFILIFVLLWFFYPLNKKRLQELQVEKEAVLEAEQIAKE